MESNFIEWQGKNIPGNPRKPFYIFHFNHFIKSLVNGCVKQYFHRFKKKYKRENVLRNMEKTKLIQSLVHS